MEKRKLTTAERIVYGKCPVCGAPHGKKCKPVDEAGTMAKMQDGAHLGRLHEAPEWVTVEQEAPKPPARKAAKTAKPKAVRKKTA